MTTTKEFIKEFEDMISSSELSKEFRAKLEAVGEADLDAEIAMKMPLRLACSMICATVVLQSVVEDDDYILERMNIVKTMDRALKENSMTDAQKEIFAAAFGNFTPNEIRNTAKAMKEVDWLFEALTKKLDSGEGAVAIIVRDGNDDDDDDDDSDPEKNFPERLNEIEKRIDEIRSQLSEMTDGTGEAES